MEISASQMVTIFIALFAIIDPFGGIPVFLAVTRAQKSVGKTALKSCVVAFIILGIFLFAGRTILNYFGVSIPAFQIGGGMIIFITGLPMLFAYQLGMKIMGPGEAGAEAGEDVSIVPLAIPMLAGPGAITTVVVMADRYQYLWGKLTVMGMCFLVLAFTCILFWQAQRLFKVIGQTGLNFFTRVMGLILIVLAVQNILTGIKDFFHF